MSGAFGDLSLAQLKLELARRGARTTGRKADLVERLRAYERNEDFSGRSQSLFVADDVPMPDWPQTIFKTITVSQRLLLPPTSSAQLSQYITLRQGVDQQSVSDVQALKKGKLMAEDSVMALSMHQDENFTYLSGSVSASMKKKISYSVKIILEPIGEVRNSHCECPGGMGPHATCKHVVSILLVLIHFVSTGEIIIAKSCTEQLQSFHRPKKAHTGSPLKAEELGEDIVENDDDPRPVCLRNRPQYNDEVAMKTINFSFHSGLDIAFRYSLPAADLSAAAEDHFYLKQDFRTY